MDSERFVCEEEENDDSDEGEIFIIKQEESQSMNLNDEVSEVSSTCDLCHAHYYHHDDETQHQDEEINQARTTFFSQQIYQQYKSTKLHELQTTYYFCDTCAVKIDHLHSLYNTLRRLQEEFEQLKTELIAEFIQGEEDEVVTISPSRIDDSKRKVCDMTVKSRSRRSSRKTKSSTTLRQGQVRESELEFKNNDNDDDDDDGSDNFVGHTEILSDSDNNQVENSDTKPHQKQQHHIKSSSKQKTARTYSCTTCHKTFTTSSHLNVHLRIHSGLRPFQCPDCPKACYTSNDLKRHSVVHSGVKDFICQFCSKGFGRRDKLKAHLASRHHGLSLNSGQELFDSEQELPKFSCQFCGRTFTVRSHLKRHLYSLHKWIASPLLCTKCPDVEFAFPSELKNHQVKVHNENVVEVEETPERVPEEIERLHQQELIDARTCPDCGLVFDKIVLLQIHCRKEFHGEARNNQCQFCGQCFTNKKSLKSHILSLHEKVQAFPCTFCKKSYKTKNQLDHHAKNHTGREDVSHFICTYCLETFKYRLKLRRHLIEVHEEEQCTKSNKSFVCKVCWQNFELDSQLQQHQSTTHFRCHVCQKLFISAKRLQVHSIIHTGEKAFQCKHCGKGFNHAFNLAEHERTHTGEKRYQCTGCAEGFVRKKLLEAHVQKSHSGL